MTCIAGVAHEGKVWIGGDSAGVGGYDLTVRADAKVFTNGEFLFGFTSGQAAEARVRQALSAAEAHSAGVRSPFVVLSA
jgi:ATP-dependent protease HslVU (ClpYQ) peptidase subunit